MTRDILGREQELGTVYAFLDRPVEGLAALVLEGEPGIGKSTLWNAGVTAARERGFRVLSARPAEAERGLAHVGFGDLFEDVLEEALPGLPAPRRHALEIALLREDAEEHAVDPRALGIAARSVLQLLREDRRLVVAVDDVQWLDDPSARALAFALRRLGDDDMLLLFARRAGVDLPPSAVEDALDAGRVERLRLGPLSLGALQGLLHARLGRTFPRPALLRLHETSGGNPFYAFELARALGADGEARDLPQPLPVPATLDRLLRDRVSGLSPATRDALAVVAAAGRATPATLRAAAIADEAFAPAFAARLVEHADGSVSFAHPLLASALYQELTPDERERAHWLLADVAEDPLTRARHLALASREPKANVAAAIEKAATVAASRAANVMAAELAEHAFRLTPVDARADRHRRAIAAARAHSLAGDALRARRDAESLLTMPLTPTERAEALIVLSDIEAPGAHERAIALRREALAAADSRPALQASIHTWLAAAVRNSEGVAAAERHARAALELAEELGDERLRAEALAILSVLRFNAGEPAALDLAEQALDLGAASGQPKRLFEASAGVVHVLTWSAQFDRARTLLENVYQEVSTWDEAATGDALWFLSLVELGAGRLALAADHAERHREISRLYAIDDREDPLSIWVVARVAAHRGELERARELAERSLELARGRPNVIAGQEGVLGLVAAWSGRPLEAVAHFSAAEEARQSAGYRAPSMYWWRAEYVEELLELGRVDTAVALLDDWEADATRLGLDWVLAQATRCRGLVAARRGDLEAALALLAETVDRQAAVADPFGRARALLALGIVSRRSRKKRAARDAIEAALEAFEQMSAAGWAANARAELGRIGGRTRQEGLTAAEHRVAALVAEGRTNREVAAALFLTEHTVERHLSHAYAKLGLRSRAELARTFRPDEQTLGEPGITT